MWPLIPIIPALFVFGLGMTSIYFGKKLSAPCLKFGGFVMSIGTLIIIILLIIAAVKEPMHPMGMNGPMMGGKCPMMEMMRDGRMMNNGNMMDMNDQACNCKCPMMDPKGRPMPNMQHKK